VNARGQNVGQVRDIAIDVRNARAPYAIISSFHSPGGERLYRVPLQFLHPLSKTSVFLENAERFSTGDAVVRNDALSHATQLVGTYVDDASGLQVGRIVDFLVDCASDRVEHVVLEFQPTAAAGVGEAFAVPLTALSPDGRFPGRLALNVPRRTFAALIGTDIAAYSPERYPRYLGRMEGAAARPEMPGGTSG